VHRAGRQAERAGRVGGRADRGGSRLRGQAGGADQQGFLEGGTVGDGGLVEYGGDGQVPGGQHAVDAQLGAWQVLLDEEGLGGGPFGLIENLPDPVAGPYRRGRVIGAQHPPGWH